MSEPAAALSFGPRVETISEEFAKYLLENYRRRDEEVLTKVVDLLEKIMAKIDEVTAELALLKTNLPAAIQRVAEDVSNLRSQIENATNLDPQLDVIINELREMNTAVTGLDPDPSFPAPVNPPSERQR